MKKGLIIASGLLCAAPLYAAEAAGHGDPVAPILLVLLLISIGAAFGGKWMRQVGQPAVLGELLIGMVVANLAYAWGEPVITVIREGETIRAIIEHALTTGASAADAARQLLPDTEQTRRLAEILGSSAGQVAIASYQFVDLLSRIAVIVLLFLVGLETSYHEMRKVGGPALAVATLGNTLGGMTSYLIGRLIPAARPLKGLAFVRRWGSPALLLSWVPLIGDPLCVAAGWLRLNPWWSTGFIAAGKFVRYWVIAVIAA